MESLHLDSVNNNNSAEDGSRLGGYSDALLPPPAAPPAFPTEWPELTADLKILASSIAAGDDFLVQVHKSGFTSASLLLGITGSGKTTLAMTLSRERLVAARNDFGFIYLTDTKGKIGQQSTKSKTYLPDLFQIPGSVTIRPDICLVDLAGWKDNRGYVEDFTTSVYNNRAVGSFQHVKLLLVVPLYKLDLSNKTGFDDVLSYALQFIRNVEKYKDSIGMVVTMVDTRVADGLVYKGILSFLKIYKGDLVVSAGNEEEAKRKLALVNILLTTTPLGAALKIAISRKPESEDEEGLGRDANLEATRTHVTLLLERLDYPVDEVDKAEDFQFARRKETNQRTDKLIHAINWQVVQEVERAMSIFQAEWVQHAKKRQQSTGLGRLRGVHDCLAAGLEETKSLHRTLLEEEEELVKDPVHLSSLMLPLFQNAGFEVPPGFEEKLEDSSRLIRFFEESTSHPHLRRVDAWISPVADAVVALSEITAWYDFCWKFERTVCSYGFHDKKTREMTPNSSDFCWVEDWRSKRDSLPPAIKEREGDVLNQIAELANKQTQTRVEEVGGDDDDDGSLLLCVIGAFVKFSEVISTLQAHPEAKEVWVLAEHTVFLDANLKAPSLALFIAAPQVEVVSIKAGKRVTINVNGADGAQYPSEKATATPSGAHGLPGIEGSPGGRIVVLTSSTIRNASLLTLSACGGKGANGQNGGAGAEGADGIDATKDDCLKCEPVTEDQHLYGISGLHFRITQAHPGHFGTSGGRGGNAGPGGKGGNPGSIHVISFGRNDEAAAGMTIMVEPGEAGSPGTPGKGGEGGSHGKGYRVERFKFEKMFKVIPSYEKEGETPRKANQEPKAASKGSDGEAAATTTAVEATHHTNRINVEDAIRLYLKTFPESVAVLEMTRDFGRQARREFLPQGNEFD